MDILSKKNILTLFSSFSLLCNMTLPLIIVNAQEEEDVTEIELIELEVENTDEVRTEDNTETEHEHEHENESEKEKQVDATTSEEETEIETEVMEENHEDLFSLEDNRDLAMEIMEQDLQRKNSRMSLFSLSHVDAFINGFSPLAVKYANANGLYPSVMLAQAALESGWGLSSLSKAPYHQLFGIKDSKGFTGETIKVPTREWIKDAAHPEGGYYITIDAEFRVYETHEGSFRDQAQFLQTSRYVNVLTKNAPTYKDATQSLQSAGYATDPEYAEKLNSIISKYNLWRFDGLPTISYTSHAQSYGWLDPVESGQVSGTIGKGKRLEAFNMQISKFDDLNIEYASFVDGTGWLDWSRNGMDTGTEGQGKRIEALKMRLAGTQAGNFDLYYRTHVQSFGWLDWSKNGEINGAEDILNKRIEAIEVRVVKKGQNGPTETSNTFMRDNSKISYMSHVQSIGWQNFVNDGEISGTTNQKKRMESIRINLYNPLINGGIEYRTHVQSYGWQDWVTNNKLSGTTGEAKRAEAIQLRLTGEMEKSYDIYYRTHSQTVGWLDWAKNGEPAGTEGKAYRLEAIQVKLVKKGEAAPGRTTQPFVK